MAWRGVAWRGACPAVCACPFLPGLCPAPEDTAPPGPLDFGDLAEWLLGNGVLLPGDPRVAAGPTPVCTSTQALGSLTWQLLATGLGLPCHTLPQGCPRVGSPRTTCCSGHSRIPAQPVVTRETRGLPELRCPHRGRCRPGLGLPAWLSAVSVCRQGGPGMTLARYWRLEMLPAPSTPSAFPWVPPLGPLWPLHQ